MNILRFDSVGGASGDMILASLIDLGADPDQIRNSLASLGLGDFTIEVTEQSSSGITGKQVTVTAAQDEHQHERHLSDITSMIKNSDLEDEIKQDAISVFRRLAEAEARVHGCSIEEVHFHEVGAVDSIVDIVGSCVARHSLKASGVVVGPLPIGQGTIKVDHGIMPIPAPATAELLKGHEIAQTEEPFELVTPTGAAILTSWRGNNADACEARLTVQEVGCGIGHRALSGRPNLLRSSLMSSSDDSSNTPDSCTVLECNIDDTIPELLGSLTEKLMGMGALDVFTTAVQMKKQRHGILLTVLCRHEDRGKLVKAIFEESTTFGLREHSVSRVVLARKHVQVQTPYGPVRVKVGAFQGQELTRMPEHDDCVALAGKKGVPVRSVYEAALRAEKD